MNALIQNVLTTFNNQLVNPKKKNKYNLILKKNQLKNKEKSDFQKNRDNVELLLTTTKYVKEFLYKYLILKKTKYFLIKLFLKIFYHIF